MRDEYSSGNDSLCHHLSFAAPATLSVAMHCFPRLDRSASPVCRSHPSSHYRLRLMTGKETLSRHWSPGDTDRAAQSSRSPHSCVCRIDGSKIMPTQRTRQPLIPSTHVNADQSKSRSHPSASLSPPMDSTVYPNHKSCHIGVPAQVSPSCFPRSNSCFCDSSQHLSLSVTTFDSGNFDPLSHNALSARLLCRKPDPCHYIRWDTSPAAGAEKLSPNREICGFICASQIISGCVIALAGVVLTAS